MTWTSEWPTEPGRYWFYGWPDDLSKKMEPATLHIVDVWRIVNGLAYVLGPRIIYAAEGACGQFMPLPDPPLPGA